MTSRSRFLVFAFGALLAGAVTAQFPGDVFLATPSNVVAQGGEVTVTVQTFTGVERFGAAHFSVEFDPSVLQFVSAALPASSVLHVSAQAKGGRIGIVVTNSRGVDKPFGIVPLADLTFRGIGQPMASSALDLTALRMISLTNVEIPTSAFDGSVLVTSPAPASPGATAAGAAPSLPRPMIVTPSEPVVATVSERLAAASFGRAGQSVGVWRAVAHDGRIAACLVSVVAAPIATVVDDVGSPVQRR